MRRCLHASAVIFALGVSFADWGSAVTPPARDVKADEPEKDVEKQEVQERRERFLKWMREFAEQTLVVEEADGEVKERTSRLVPIPVFRYADEARKIRDATLWVWTRNARPVAFQKIEAEHLGGPEQWTICFASLSERLLKASWPGGNKYAAQKPGVTFRPIPKADAPADNVRTRSVQLKTLKDRFTGRLDVEQKFGGPTRTMAKPIFEYSDPESNLPLGAIFGMSAYGTNPDLLLLIEARRDGDGKWRWEYALARMTIASLRVHLDEAEVWSEEFSPPGNPVLGNWTFFFLPRDVN
jgi:hypothetical protein